MNPPSITFKWTNQIFFTATIARLLLLKVANVRGATPLIICSEPQCSVWLNSCQRELWIKWKQLFRREKISVPTCFSLIAKTPNIFVRNSCYCSIHASLISIDQAIVLLGATNRKLIGWGIRWKTKTGCKCFVSEFGKMDKWDFRTEILAAV